MEFEWNPAKAKANEAKHGIKFEQAVEVFGDPFALTIDDPIHSTAEQRFVTMGRTTMDLIVVVAYTDRDQVIRIISARKAVPSERRQYEKNRGR